MASKKPIKLLTLDTETYNGLIGDLKRIAVYDGLNVTYGYTFEDVERVLLQYNKVGYDVHCYIHNMEFDARKIPQVFSEERIVWEKCFIIKGKIATITTKHYTLHDSFKLLPMSLAKLSKGFDVTHAKLDLWEEVNKQYPCEYVNIVDFLDRCDKDNHLYLEYLGYDVISLYEIIQKLIELTGIPERDFVKRISTASLSRYLFKNGYKGKQFQNDFNSKTDYEILGTYNWKNNIEVEEFLRAGYCGGRVEVFTPLLEKLGKHYDVNSLYPFCMLGEFPVGKPRYITKPQLAKQQFEEWRKLKVGLGFLNCHLYIPKQNIPPLPVKMGKLCFPCGHVFGVWTYEELEYAMEHCGVEIIEYYECCHFDNTYPVFKNFIDCFYEMKEQATRDKNESLRTFAKLIQNVGYGYTGMRRDDKTSLKPYKDHDKYIGKIVFASKELGYIEVPTEIKAEYIQVQVASYVTSRARLVLLKALKDADEKGTVYYCDTDSIVTDVTLSPDIVDAYKLGFWDLESEPEKAIFLKPKVYSEVFQDKTNIKFKGVSRETQKDLSFNDYEYLLEEIEKGEKDYIIVEKNRLQMRSIMYMKKKDLDFSYHETRDKKINLKTVEKRIMDYENNKTEPLYFNSLESFKNFSFKPIKQYVDFDMTKAN